MFTVLNTGVLDPRLQSHDGRLQVKREDVTVHGRNVAKKQPNRKSSIKPPSLWEVNN